MPLVFVHGVNVRRGRRYERLCDRRNYLFRSVSLRNVLPQLTDDHISNPYWGDEGAPLNYDLLVAPDMAAEVFGSSDDEVRSLLLTVPTGATKETFFVELARGGAFLEAVDVLCGAARIRFSRTDNADVPGAAMDDFGERAFAYARANPEPSWLSTVRTDQDLIGKLTAAVAGEPSANPGDESERFGGMSNKLRDFLKLTADAVGSIAVSTLAKTRTAARGIEAFIERGLVAPAAFIRVIGHHGVARFVGDVVTYLSRRTSAEGSFFSTIRTAVADADTTSQRTGEPLIVVGHSLGGVLLYDVLSSATTASAVTLLTVGSQVGLFGLLGTFDGYRRGSKLPRPPTVSRWLNVYDASDVLSFAAVPVFDDVEDYRFDLETPSFDHHGAYFFSQHFHERLCTRLEARREPAAGSI
jgi:hypothetical protein